MKKRYLTFDIEVMVSKRSYNPAMYSGILLGALLLADELCKRNLKATFFLALSPKTNDISCEEYFEVIDLLCRALKGFENIKVMPHLHCKNIPVSFDTQSDLFADYNLEQQVELLKWGRAFLRERGMVVNVFRPGSYSTGERYYLALKKAGYAYSSVISSRKNIDLVNDKIDIEYPYSPIDLVSEYPVTTVAIKSIKGGINTLNLSPDFFTLGSVKDYMEKMDYLNVNFHSFSVFQNRFARENHQGVWFNNIFYFFFERPILRVLNKFFSLEMVNKNTIFKKELIRWLNYFEKEAGSTRFIGE